MDVGSSSSEYLITIKIIMKIYNFFFYFFFFFFFFFLTFFLLLFGKIKHLLSNGICIENINGWIASLLFYILYNIHTILYIGTVYTYYNILGWIIIYLFNK